MEIGDGFPDVSAVISEIGKASRAEFLRLSENRSSLLRLLATNTAYYASFHST